MREHPQSQGIVLLIVWIAALLACLWLASCAPAPRDQASGRPASVATASRVWTILFPLVETGVRWLVDVGLDAIRPADQATVSEPVRENYMEGQP